MIRRVEAQQVTVPKEVQMGRQSIEEVVKKEEEEAEEIYVGVTGIYIPDVAPSQLPSRKSSSHSPSPLLLRGCHLPHPSQHPVLQ